MARLSHASPRGSAIRSAARPPSRKRWVGAVALTAAGLLLLCVVGYLYRGAGSQEAHTIAGLRVHGVSLSSMPLTQARERIAQITSEFASQTVALSLNKDIVLRLSRQDLGVRVDVPGTVALAHRVGRSGHLLRDVLTRLRAAVGRLDIPLFVDLDRDQSLKVLMRIKQRFDRPPVEPRLDLDNRIVHEGRVGHSVDAYGCLQRAEDAMRQGRGSFSLVVSARQPAQQGRFRGLDISQVLGRFATVYSLADKDQDRAHNLGLGATRLTGRVLQPGASLSFNETVGPRSPAQGYRTAPVITAGELVDGMAGGACQLSSTLFAAAFFAGLDLVKSRPHTMPSSYIKMGLDAAVAFPHIDLVLRNPYDFAVAISLTVNRGRVSAAVLGPQRPWRRITFRRIIKERQPFSETVRQDPTLPRGVRVITQAGVPGYLLERQRLFFAEGKEPTRQETRTVRYPPTTQILTEGTGPSLPDFVAPVAKQPFRDAKDELSVSQ